MAARRPGPINELPEWIGSTPAYTARFLAPARDLLGDRLAGVLFEQEYQRQAESPPPEAFAAELDGFFGHVAGEGPAVPTHVEVRSPYLQAPPFFDVLDRHGLGFVFSHWTWLGPLAEQWRRAGERFHLADGEAAVRLLTPLRVKYADAYAQAYPFDRVVPELAKSEGARRMIEETVDLVRKATEAGARINVIANNRAYGNAPALARDIAHQLLNGS